MGNLTPAQMFDHSLNVVKGPSLMHRLDYHAAPATGQTSIEMGSLISLNNAGQIVRGCSNGVHYNRPMPMWALQGINDFDANSDVGNISGGVMSGIVATGGFEIETTEYVTATYRSNDLLTGALAGDLGKVKRASGSPYLLQTICGVVTKNVWTNQDGKTVLSFWTVYLPAATNHVAESTSSQTSESSASSTP